LNQPSSSFSSSSQLWPSPGGVVACNIKALVVICAVMTVIDIRVIRNNKVIITSSGSCGAISLRHSTFNELRLDNETKANTVQNLMY
jgi:hypothetical protein